MKAVTLEKFGSLYFLKLDNEELVELRFAPSISKENQEYYTNLFLSAIRQDEILNLGRRKVSNMVERVAKALEQAMIDDLNQQRHTVAITLARAASAVVVEECAQVVDHWRRGYGLKNLAEAIRALK